VILERASQYDLLAIGAPATSWLGGALIGGVGATALGSFTTPLLAARAVRGARHFARRVLVASDGSHDSDHVVALAGRLARSQDAKLTLLHVVGIEGRARPRRIHEQARTLELAFEGQSELRIEAGRARGVIVETARSARASLVVMGSRRLEGLRALGSVSRRVVHDAHCSVLLVPPEDPGA
jgi:nucleotide-binding universal stress UspA family protein